MAETITQRYGFPFTGYRFATASHLATRNHVVGDSTLISQGFLLDPIEGKLMRRGGTASVGSVSGVLETLATATTPFGRQILPLDSPSLSDGYPTHLVLFLDESKSFGWLYWRDGSTDYNLGKSYSGSHYPPTLSVAAEWIVIPVAYTASGVGLTRGINELNRRFFVSGSRRVVQVGRDLYSPGHTSAPSCWREKRWNISDSSGTEPERFGPTGLIPPLHPGRFVTASAPTETTTTSAWKNGDRFYASCAFVNEVGEVSAPYIPSGGTGTTRTNEYITDLGLVTVPGTAGSYRQYLRREAVPIGPGGTRARLMLRSEKVDSTLAGAFPNRLRLLVCGIIRDNTTTTFDDYSGSDLALLEAPETVRLDRKWPDRARYAWPFDHRVAVSYLSQNPYAIIIAPTGAVAARDVNNADTAVVPVGAHYFAVRNISGAVLQLRYSTGSSFVETSISTSGTLQSVVDLINATVVGGTGKEWCAQLVPGVSPDIPASKLILTYFTVGGCSSSAATVTTSQSFTGVAVGMLATHANIPDDTYVTAVASDKSLTISATPTSPLSAATVGFSVDTGDNHLAGGSPPATFGNVYAKGNSWPVVLPLTAAYLADQPDQVLDLLFTTGGPLDPPNAANSYAVSNRRPVPAEAGIAMGGAPLLNGATVYYSRGIGRLYNVRGGKTGEDVDYRAEIETWGRGCISPYSIVYGDGWTGALTDEGFEVRDSTSSRIISFDVYNPSTKTGEWSYEMGKCKNAAETDGTDYQFYAHVAEGKLWVSFRRAAASGPGGAEVATHIMCYDFSAGVTASGLAEVLRPDGTPWGWSTPLTYSWRGHSASAGVAGCIGSVRKSDGLYLYTCDDTDDKTWSGLVQRIENGTWTDASTRVTAAAYLALDLHDTMQRKSPVAVRIMRSNTGAAERVKVYRSKAQAGEATVSLVASSGPFALTHVPLPLSIRSTCDVTQLLLEAIGSVGSVAVHYHGAELDVEMLPAYRTDGG